MCGRAQEPGGGNVLGLVFVVVVVVVGVGAEGAGGGGGPHDAVVPGGPLQARLGALSH